MTESRNTHNTLRPDQRFKLFQLMDRDRELAPKYRKIDMAARFAEELGFPVTTANVSHAAKAVGAKFRRGGSSSGKRGSRVVRLERAIKVLCKQLGVDFASLTQQEV